MKLRRRYIRNIRQNLSFYIASTVLTMAALFLFFLFHIAGNAILDFADEFFEKQKLEDAHFTTYIPIPESDIDDMEEVYEITLEAQSYINIDTDGTTARVFQKTRKVDLYDVTEGEDTDEKGEVILSEGYAVNMDISIGDQIRIGEEDYTVTGFFQRPDSSHSSAGCTMGSSTSMAPAAFISRRTMSFALSRVRRPSGSQV